MELLNMLRSKTAQAHLRIVGMDNWLKVVEMLETAASETGVSQLEIPNTFLPAVADSIIIMLDMQGIRARYNHEGHSQIHVSWKPHYPR